MKKLLLTVIIVSSAILAGFGQAGSHYDLATLGVQVNNSANSAPQQTAISVGQTANFNFVVYNAGGGPELIPTGTAEVTFSFPSTDRPYKYTGPSIITGTYFRLEYDQVEKVLHGYNIIPIVPGDGDLFVAQVTGTATGTFSAPLNLTQLIVGDALSGNNSAFAPLSVLGIVAVKIKDIAATNLDCAAKIKWTTGIEDAGSSFDVEYSPDARYFVKVGTVPVKGVNGSVYEYSYNQGNGRGYYRLKATAANGAVEYTNVVTATTKCEQKKVFIYPNPVQVNQELHVNVAGYAGKIKGEMFTSDGKLMMTKALVNGSNLVPVTNMAQGVYNFKVTDENGETTNYKVVVNK